LGEGREGKGEKNNNASFFLTNTGREISLLEGKAKIINTSLSALDIPEREFS